MINLSIEEKEKFLILYLNNPDKVFYSEMDDVIIKNLEKCGMIVRKVEMEDINFQLEANCMKIFIKDEQIKINGFLAY